MGFPFILKGVFRKRQRIKKSVDVYSVIKSGKRYRYKCLSLFVLDKNRLKSFGNDNTIRLSRLGIICSKKILKRAIDRNVFKRAARDFFRIYINNKCFFCSDIVIRLDTAPFKTNHKYYFNELKKLFAKIDIV